MFLWIFDWVVVVFDLWSMWLRHLEQRLLHHLLPPYCRSKVQHLYNACILICFGFVHSYLQQSVNNVHYFFKKAFTNHTIIIHCYRY